jgi:hypothetical protein
MTRLSLGRRMRGGSLVEFVLVIPALLMVGLALIQYSLMYHAKSQLNYASFEGARAGSIANGKLETIEDAIKRALVGYYGGGRDVGELADAYARMNADLAKSALRIEVLSPTKESFDDYASPALASALKTSARVIPNVHIAHLSCPRDNPGCNSDPATNSSGQSLVDANLLKLRITYGIPPQKQIPLVGPFMNWALDKFLMASDPDAFRKSLLADGRLPVVSHATIRMQSEAIENEKTVSIPGPGSATPSDPGTPPTTGEPLPNCPLGDPDCKPKPPACDPFTDPRGCRPPGCAEADPTCDPGCGTRYCCIPK